MKSPRFDQFFSLASHFSEPYDYQRRLAGGDSGTECKSQLINIPTGLGKTAAVVLAWLWNRVQLQNPKWPRRLVYCLPMRTLVEQTRDNVRGWLKSLDGREWNNVGPHEGKVGVHILMGGEGRERNPWDLYPEENAILIGTQDMLLSRALNRGYGMSRYRWPMHFGLLNNDSLWVLDETQLMGVGVETSAQLDGFRNNGKMPTFGACPTWWMSATLEETRLLTVDHPKPVDGWPTEKLSEAEQTSGRPHQLITARKKLLRAPLVLDSTTKVGYAKQLAALVRDCHQDGTLTLVVVNRVSRAREIFEALTAGKKPFHAPEKTALIHSRFRPIDRERHTRLLFGEGDRIVIATQAVEAGVDVSARLLITELAPWASLVQRMGRCNRRADIDDALVLWIDILPKDDNDDLLRPYSAAELTKARAMLEKLTDASPRALGDLVLPPERVIRPVIRRRDLVDLFDTTPDICGQDLDVSRYIRDGEDSDVQFFWRAIQEEADPSGEEKSPRREELCRVSIGEAQKFIAKQSTRVWLWNPLEEIWRKAERGRPGAVYLIDSESGGYDNDLGWTGEPKNKPTPCPLGAQEAESYRKDPQTFAHYWLSLDRHTQGVVAGMTSLAESLSLASKLTNLLRTAALWHDVGKAHPVFQKMLCGNDVSRLDTLWAKSEYKNGECERTGFRHELASALAWLSFGPQDAPEHDLIAYLIAAHHGKVRLSIRAMPDERGDPADPDRLYARGIWHKDRMPSVDGILSQPVSLNLHPMRMGEGESGSSWLARTTGLRERFGSFYLAWLETLLRAADSRASALEETRANPLTDGATEEKVLQETSPAYPAESVPLSPAQQALVADLVADGLAIQSKFRPEPLYKQTGKGYFGSETVEEIRRAKESKPKGKEP